MCRTIRSEHNKTPLLHASTKIHACNNHFQTKANVRNKRVRRSCA